MTGDPLERVSIVVPVGPGESAWRPLYEMLRHEASAAELLPVFAADDPQIKPDNVLHAQKGRARQQNAGAAAATREWLWFVHADTRLTPEALPALRAWLLRETFALGWFRLRFANDGPRAMRWNARGANWRARALGLPFGDQGFVLPRRIFDAWGGFDETRAFGEDHALVWQARRAGVPLHEIDAALVTSARRYADRGWLATTLRHLLLTAMQAWREWQR